jgi:hypothetical protein
MAPSTTFQATDLSRHHREVLDAARRPGGAVIRDKDGVSLLITYASGVSLDQYVLAGIKDAVRVLGLLTMPAELRDPIQYGDLAWVALLPENDQATFIWEYVRALEATAATGIDVVEQLVYEWQQTARAWSDADLRAQLTGDLDEPVADVAL